MTESEIVYSYRTAKHPLKQIKILADLCPWLGEHGIYRVLIQNGIDLEIPDRVKRAEERERKIKARNEAMMNGETSKRKRPEKKTPMQKDLTEETNEEKEVIFHLQEKEIEAIENVKMLVDKLHKIAKCTDELKEEIDSIGKMIEKF